MKGSVLCIGKPHANAVHAYHDAKRMAHYFLDLGFTVTLMDDLPPVQEQNVEDSLLWFSGEYEDLAAVEFIPLAKYRVYDCCRMGARIRPNATQGHVWCAAEKLAYNMPMQGSLFAQAIWTWIQNNATRSFFDPEYGFNPAVVLDVSKQVREVTRTYSNSPQNPVIGNW